MQEVRNHDKSKQANAETCYQKSQPGSQLQGNNRKARDQVHGMTHELSPRIARFPRATPMMFNGHRSDFLRGPIEHSVNKDRGRSVSLIVAHQVRPKSPERGNRTCKRGIHGMLHEPLRHAGCEIPRQPVLFFVPGSVHEIKSLVNLGKQLRNFRRGGLKVVVHGNDDFVPRVEDTRKQGIVLPVIPHQVDSPHLRIRDD